jgi:DNA primase
MRFPPHFLDDIRAKLPVSDVVGQSVRLKKQGREWAGLSPFNKEKSPSFFVNDQKGFYHCFSSGKHGDVFDFLMETQGMAFPEAVEKLASMAGLTVPQDSPAQEEHSRQRAGLYEIMDLAARFFLEQLAQPAGREARAYIDQRGLTRDTCGTFQIGYAPPGRTALKHYLRAKKIPVEDALEAGLLIGGEDIPEPYDRFRDRIMFPIHDVRGKIIAFGGRALAKEARAKYLNSPETPLFHKGHVLYNHHRARPIVPHAGTVIAVEGYMDVIALSAAGIGHVVAPLGTALTVEQIGLMWRMTDEPILCFDGDKAGQRAAHRALDTALPALRPGKSLRFAFLPEGQDPDDLLRNAGRSALDIVLERAVPFVDVLWARETEGQSMATPERRAAVEARLHALVHGIQDENVRKHYHAAMNEKQRALSAPQRYQGRAGNGQGYGPQAYNRRTAFGGRGRPVFEMPLTVSAHFHAQGVMAPARLPAREAALLMAVVRHPWLLGRFAEEAAMVEFSAPDLTALQRVVLEISANDETLEPGRMEAQVIRTLGAAHLARVEAAVPPGTWWVRADAGENDVQTAFEHTLALHIKTHALHKELVAAEAELGADLTEENFTRLADIQAELRAVEGTEAMIEGFGAESGRGGSSL